MTFGFDTAVAVGQMVAFAPPQMISVPIAEAVGRLRRVDLAGNLVRSARALGICLATDT